MLTCLAEGYPFIFGFTVYKSFKSQEAKRTGIAHMPKKGERAIGDHGGGGKTSQPSASSCVTRGEKRGAWTGTSPCRSSISKPLQRISGRFEGEKPPGPFRGQIWDATGDRPEITGRTVPKTQ